MQILSIKDEHFLKKLFLYVVVAWCSLGIGDRRIRHLLRIILWQMFGSL